MCDGRDRAKYVVRTVLQRGKYCSLEQRSGGVDVKDLHIQRENSMKYLPERKRYVCGPTRPEIKKEFKYSKLWIIGLTDNPPALVKEYF